MRLAKKHYLFRCYRIDGLFFNLLFLLAMGILVILAQNSALSLTGSSLNAVVEPYLVKRATMVDLLQVAAVRQLNDDEAAKLKALTFDLPPNASVNDGFTMEELQLRLFSDVNAGLSINVQPGSLTDSSEFVAAKVIDFLRYATFVDHVAGDSWFSIIPSVANFALAAALIAALIAQAGNVGSVFNPREIALATIHPQFSILALQFAVMALFWVAIEWIAALETKSSLESFAGVLTFLRSNQFDLGLAGAGPSASDWKFPVVVAFLTDSSSDRGFLWGVGILAPVTVCIVLASIIVGKREGPDNLLGALGLGGGVVAAVAFIYFYFLMPDLIASDSAADIFTSRSRIDADKATFWMYPARVSLMELFLLCLFLGALLWGFMLRRVTLLYAGYLAVPALCCAILTESLGPVSPIGIIPLMALIIVAVSVVEFLLSQVLRWRVYDPRP